MSRQLISRSPDLKRLRGDGYEVEIRSNHLLVSHVPYVDADRGVRFGVLVSELTLAGDVTAKPSSHVVMFAGATPCDTDGHPLTKILNSSGRRDLADGVVIDHTFSSKPVGSGAFADYYEKVTAYAAILSGPAESIDPTATARTFRVVEELDDDSPFKYSDTATARAGTNIVSTNLEVERVAIVGLGGTGSYILDLVAKTPIREIHLFDGDRFLQHNAFRAPGAPSVDELSGGPKKVDYFAGVYSKMRRNIVPHPNYVDESNIHELRGMSFVFLALDKGKPKHLLVTKLEEFGIPFIDVGMGVSEDDGALGGILRVTTCTPDHPAQGRDRIPFSDGDANNDYSQNIQIADLNAFNAAFAVIKWKKLLGFYRDLENEHFSAYTIDGNQVINEDQT
jgi:ThiF family